MSDEKVVHIEAIPVFDTDENKIIHVAVNTVDVVNMYEPDMEQEMPIDFDIDLGVEYLVKCYRKMLIDSFLYSSRFYGGSEERNKLQSYKLWRKAQNQFLENGFRDYLDTEERMKKDDELF